MGQRDGFSRNDLLKLNKMYNCDINTSIGSGNSGGGVIKPPRPNGNGFNQALGGFISGVGSFFSGLGGKHDGVENSV